MAAKARQLASAAKMPHYVGIGHANQGWAELVLAGSDLAHEELQTALGIWRSELPVYPMQWLAIWPLVDLFLQRERPADALPLLAFLLEESQERPPEELEQRLRRLGDGSDPGQMRAAVEAARRHGYL